MNPIATINMPRQEHVATTKPNNEIREILGNTIGHYLKEKRTTTMKQTAEDIGCDMSYLSKIENEHVIPPWDMVQRLIDYYGVSRGVIPALAWKHLMQSKQDQFSMAIAFSGLVE